MKLQWKLVLIAGFFTLGLWVILTALQHWYLREWGIETDGMAESWLSLLVISLLMGLLGPPVLRMIRRETELAARVRASEARYRAVVEDQTELICRFRPDGTLTFVNAAGGRYFNRTGAELIGRSFFSLLTADERAAIEPQLAALSSGRPLGSAQTRVPGPEQQERWQEWTFRAIHDPAGKLIEYQAVGRDITPLKAAEAEIRRSAAGLQEKVAEQTAELITANRALLADHIRREQVEAALRWSERLAAAIINSAYDGVLVITPAAAILELNEIAANRLGRPRAELIGANLWSLLPEAVRAVRQPHLDRAVREREVVRFTDERAGMILDQTIYPIVDDHGQIGRLVIFAHDISEQRQAGLALQRAEERFRIASTSTSDLVYDRELATGRIAWSGAVDQLLGYAPGTFPHTFAAWAEHVHPDDLARVSAARMAAAEPGTPFSVQYRVRHADGNWLHWVDRGQILADAQGKPERIIGSIKDITEPIRLKEQLVAAEKKYRALIEQLPAIVYTITAEPTGSAISYISPQVELYTGRAPAEFISEPGLWPQLVHPGDRERIGRLLAEALTSRRQFSEEYRVVAGPGRELWVLDEARPVSDETGRPLLQGMIIDITARKALEDELRWSERTGKTILDAPLDGVVLINPAGIILDVNRVVARRFGKPPAELIGTFYYDQLAAPLVVSRRRGLEQLLATGEIVRFEDGAAERAWEVTMYPVTNEAGAIERVIILSRDLTERRQAERALAEAREKMVQADKLSSLGKLAAGIAHEINQPLAGISMGLDNISFRVGEQNRLEPEYLREKFKSLFEYIERIKQIIEHIRIFSREQVSERLEPFDLNTGIRNALMLVQAQYRAHDLEVVTELAAPLPPVRGNLYRFEQVVLNLLSNARDALDERGAGPAPKQIVVRTQVRGDRVEVVVEDNGVGIPAEALPGIFDPFFTTKPPDRGTGLGLSIVHGIVREMGGEIAVTSQAGAGTTVTITVPAINNTESGQ